MNAYLVIGLAGTALLIGFMYLRHWYGRRRVAETIFSAAFANGAIWALGAGLWVLFQQSGLGYDFASGFGVVLFLFVLYGIVSLVPVATVAAVYHKLRRSE